MSWDRYCLQSLQTDGKRILDGQVCTFTTTAFPAQKPLKTFSLIMTRFQSRIRPLVLSARSDFWIFGHMKEALAEQLLTGQSKFLRGIQAFLEEMQTRELEHVFHHWIKSVRGVLVHHGGHFHG
jgi:hypothetical protein